MAANTRKNRQDSAPAITKASAMELEEKDLDAAAGGAITGDYFKELACNSHRFAR